MSSANFLDWPAARVEPANARIHVGSHTRGTLMRWFVFILLVLSLLGFLLFSVSEEADAVGNLQGHRTFNVVGGFACILILFVLAVGVYLLLVR